MLMRFGIVALIIAAGLAISEYFHNIYGVVVAGAVLYVLPRFPSPTIFRKPEDNRSLTADLEHPLASGFVKQHDENPVHVGAQPVGRGVRSVPGEGTSRAE